MRRSVIPLLLLALGGLACSLSGGGSPINAPDALATGAAATLTALAAPASASSATLAPATSAPGQTGTAAVTHGPASSTPAAAATETPAAPATSAATAAATGAATAGPTIGAPSATTALAGCKLAYADKDSLFCVPDLGTPRSLATGAKLFDPRISPDGSLIAYSVVITDGVTQLWVAAVAEGGEAPHVLVGQDQLPSADSGAGGAAQINSPNHYEWLAGTHTLVFDTRYLPTSGPGGPGEYINADLWTVYADTAAVATLLPAGQAGLFAASPDGHTIAVSRGTGLDLIDVDGSNPHSNVVTFPAIITYSEYTYKPRPQWSADGSYFTVAVPSKDPQAASSSVAFYKVSADGAVTPRGTHPGNYVFGGGIAPQIAPDGAHVVFSKGNSAGGPDALHMLTIQSGALGDNAFDSQNAPRGWGWSPDSQVYAYTVVGNGAAGKGYATGPGVENSHVFADHLTGLSALLWVDGSHLVFLGQVNGGDWALYQQTSGSEPAAAQKVASGLSEQATFDVRP